MQYCTHGIKLIPSKYRASVADTVLIPVKTAYAGESSVVLFSCLVCSLVLSLPCHQCLLFSSVSEFCYPLSPWSCPRVCLISLCFHVYSSVVQYYVKFMCLGLDRVCCFLFYFGSLLPVYCLPLFFAVFSLMMYEFTSMLTSLQ